MTINKLMDMKAAGFDVVVLIANLHAYLNRKGTFEQIKELAEYNKACIEACGLKGAEFVLGTDVQLTPKYQTEVLTLCQEITLNRATRTDGLADGVPGNAGCRYSDTRRGCGCGRN